MFVKLDVGCLWSLWLSSPLPPLCSYYNWFELSFLTCNLSLLGVFGLSLVPSRLLSSYAPIIAIPVKDAMSIYTF